jgi:hypothetical protein
VNLLVVGLDLETGREVHVTDRGTKDWHAKGHNGDRTLICALCYAGADLPGGPRCVALVPRGRRGGIRRQHFAHPPGMAPPGGQHSPETLWHATAKHRLRRWAADRGATARIEACTPDRRRRSDVAITLPGGEQLALEVQLGELSDAAWLARHQDYARAGITDIWLWHEQTWIPRVMFAHGQPGWILDQDHRKLGLLYAYPGPGARPQQPSPGGCGQMHWPPCPDDPTRTHWMPLQEARLTADGIQPSPQALTDLARQAAARARPPSPAAQARPAAARRTAPKAAGPYRSTVDRSYGLPPEPPDGTHHAFNYESRPPWTSPDTWRHYCETCSRTLTLADLKASPITHIVPTVTPSPTTGHLQVSYTRYPGRLLL